MNQRSPVLPLILLVFLSVVPAAAQTGASSGSSEDARKFNTQAVALYKEGKYEEAIKQQKQAIALWEKELGKENKTIANGFTNLAEMYRALKRYREAGDAYQRVLKIEEKLLGHDHSSLVGLLIKIAWMRHGALQAVEAEIDFKRAVAILENEGNDHSALADPLLNLAAFYQKTGRPAVAVSVYERIIAIQEKKFGIDGQPLVNTLEQCACSLRMIKKPLDASKMEQRAAIIERKAKPDITPVDGGVLQGYAIHKEAPPYPSGAMAERLSGSVFIKVTIDETGKVLDAKILCGADLLAVSAREAALKWRFKPTTIDGNPVKVVGILTFNFSL